MVTSSLIKLLLILVLIKCKRERVTHQRIHFWVVRIMMITWNMFCRTKPFTTHTPSAYLCFSFNIQLLLITQVANQDDNDSIVIIIIMMEWDWEIGIHVLLLRLLGADRLTGGQSPPSAFYSIPSGGEEPREPLGRSLSSASTTTTTTTTMTLLFFFPLLLRLSLVYCCYLFNIFFLFFFPWFPLSF